MLIFYVNLYCVIRFIILILTSRCLLEFDKHFFYIILLRIWVIDSMYTFYRLSSSSLLPAFACANIEILSSWREFTLDPMNKVEWRIISSRSWSVA
jgi:hypothetical protein